MLKSLLLILYFSSEPGVACPLLSPFEDGMINSYYEKRMFWFFERLSVCFPRLR